MREAISARPWRAKFLPVVGVRLVREGRAPYVGGLIRTPAEACAVVGAVIGDLDRECFAVILLDTKHRPLAVHAVSVGGLAFAPVSPREVFKAALLANAAAVILAHNHPSGEPEPSVDDVRLTVRLQSAGELLGVDVLDHVIIGAPRVEADGARGYRFVSLRERGHLGGGPERGLA